MVVLFWGLWACLSSGLAACWLFCRCVFGVVRVFGSVILLFLGLIILWGLGWFFGVLVCKWVCCVGEHFVVLS